MSSTDHKMMHVEMKEISQQAAKAILDHARETLKHKEYLVLALPGGRSVTGIYDEFARSEDPVWKKIHLFVIDERAVPISHDESNFKLIKESFAEKLVKKGILPDKNLHPLIIDERKKDNGASQYTDELAKYGGKFDIVLVSSGEDGHIASLYPEHEALSKAGGGFIYLDDSPKPPQRRITASVELIAGADFGVLLFIGEQKREAYERFNDRYIPIIQCPAKIIRKLRNSVIYTDIMES